MDNDSISSSYTSEFTIFFDEDNLSARFLDLWFQLNVLVFFLQIYPYKYLAPRILYIKIKKQDRVMKINKSYQNDKKPVLTCDLNYDPNIMFCNLDPL